MIDANNLLYLFASRVYKLGSSTFKIEEKQRGKHTQSRVFIVQTEEKSQWMTSLLNAIDEMRQTRKSIHSFLLAFELLARHPIKNCVHNVTLYKHNSIWNTASIINELCQRTWTRYSERCREGNGMDNKIRPDSRRHIPQSWTP